jgi:SAM-dependent methyltransferase
MSVFVLEPPIRHPIQSSFVPVFGWYRGVAAPRDIDVRACGEPVHVELHPRTDLHDLFPNDFTTGVYAVVDLARHRRTIESTGGRLTVRVRIDGVTYVDESIDVPATILRAAANNEARRLVKRAFVLAHSACPVCGTPLTVPSSDPATIICDCGARFMQNTSAVNLIAGETEVPRILSTSLCVYSPEERRLIDGAARTGGMVLDLGAGLRATIEAHVINLEIADYPTTDVLAASDRLPFQDQTFDGIIALHVLEHLKHPWITAAEITRVLKPGGRALCTVPFVCPEHGFPDHYFNMTRSGLRSLFEGLTLEQHFLQGDAHPMNGLQQLLSTYHGNLPEEIRPKFTALTVGEILQTSLGELVAKDYAVALPEYARWKLAAHTTISLRKPG